MVGDPHEVAPYHSPLPTSFNLLDFNSTSLKRIKPSHMVKYLLWVYFHSLLCASLAPKWHLEEKKLSRSTTACPWNQNKYFKRLQVNLFLCVVKQLHSVAGRNIFYTLILCLNQMKAGYIKLSRLRVSCTSSRSFKSLRNNSLSTTSSYLENW